MKIRKLDIMLSDVKDVTKIDVIAVDVEGWELECLRAFRLARCSEGSDCRESLSRPSLYRFHEKRGYELWRVLEPNDIYFLYRRQSLRLKPACKLDVQAFRLAVLLGREAP